jgi:hypothetical protein
MLYPHLINGERYIVAANELIRVLKHGGQLLMSVPVGRERLCFDAHRIFNTKTIISLMSTLQLVEFSFIDDLGMSIQESASLDMAHNCDWGCGLFHFIKP